MSVVRWPHEVAQHYGESVERASLKTKEVAACVVLLIDIAGFTSFCERSKLADVLRVISDYFSCMSDCVNCTNGVVDRMIGDALLGTWDAVGRHPAAGVAAITSALNMLGVIRNKAVQWDRIRCRIGIAKGSALVGNFGSVQRFQHGVMGPVVQLVEAMESGNSKLGTSLLLASGVVDSDYLVREAFPVRFAGRLQVGPTAEAATMRMAGGASSAMLLENALVPRPPGMIEVYEVFMADELFPRAVKNGALQQQIRENMTASAPPQSPAAMTARTASFKSSKTQTRHLEAQSGRRVFSDDGVDLVSVAESKDGLASSVREPSTPIARVAVAGSSDVTSLRVVSRLGRPSTAMSAGSRLSKRSGTSWGHVARMEVRYSRLLRYQLPMKMSFHTLLSDVERSILRKANAAMHAFYDERWVDAGDLAGDVLSILSSMTHTQGTNPLSHLSPTFERMKILSADAIRDSVTGGHGTLDANRLFDLE